MAFTPGPDGDNPALLATFDDAVGFGSGPIVLKTFTTDTAQTDLMARATRQIEARCHRRLAPFSGLFESHRAEGVDQETLGQPDIPLDLTSALGVSQEIAFASTSLVRDFWLHQYPPEFADMWSYTIESIQLALAYGDVIDVDPVGGVEGPEVDTGWLRLHLGIFCPVGTIVKIIYSGGYQTIPEDLNTACVFQAFKLAMLGAQAQDRKDMTYAEIDTEILSLIAPYIR